MSERAIFPPYQTRRRDLRRTALPRLAPDAPPGDEPAGLQAYLGYTNVFGADIRVNIVSAGLVAAALRAAEQAVSDYVTGVFQEYVKAPVLSVSLSYRLQ